jgi:hypothetical protein
MERSAFGRLQPMRHRGDRRRIFRSRQSQSEAFLQRGMMRLTVYGDQRFDPGRRAGLDIRDEFREGNAAPAARNLEFVQSCERNMPKSKRVKTVRADSAAYQADVLNYCEETHKVFAIGADQDAAVKAAIAAIPEGEWKMFRDGEIAETVHCMNKTDKAFRLIGMRRPRDQDLYSRTSRPTDITPSPAIARTKTRL